MTPALKTLDITVTDLDAAMAFYQRLGLTFVVDAHMPGHAGCDLPDGLHIMLDTVDLRSGMSPGWQRSAGDGRTFLCFEFTEPKHVDAKYTELVEAGYRGLSEPFDAPWGMRYATVCDPDGNGVDLYAIQLAS